MKKNFGFAYFLFHSSTALARRKVPSFSLTYKVSELESVINSAHFPGESWAMGVVGKAFGAFKDSCSLASISSLCSMFLKGSRRSKAAASCVKKTVPRGKSLALRPRTNYRILGG
jgi:hypothetical protein